MGNKTRKRCKKVMAVQVRIVVILQGKRVYDEEEAHGWKIFDPDICYNDICLIII